MVHKINLQYIIQIKIDHNQMRCSYVFRLHYIIAGGHYETVLVLPKDSRDINIKETTTSPHLLCKYCVILNILNLNLLTLYTNLSCQTNGRYAMSRKWLFMIISGESIIKFTSLFNFT